VEGRRESYKQNDEHRTDTVTKPDDMVAHLQDHKAMKCINGPFPIYIYEFTRRGESPQGVRFVNLSLCREDTCLERTHWLGPKGVLSSQVFLYYH
jgi:hypothetical protein